MSALERALQKLASDDRYIADSSMMLIQLAQAEAADRQAAALERIAAATERRNELLAEFNEQSKTGAATHTEKMAESVNSFLDAHFGKDEE